MTRATTRASHLVASIAVMLAGLATVLVLGAGAPTAPSVVASRPNGEVPAQASEAPVPPAAGELPADTVPVTTEPEPAPIGSQAFLVPAGAIVVAVGGDDASPGTAELPVATVTRALELAPAGGTIVVRAGTYHESLTITTTVVIQSWPGEQVWFDGSTVVPSWVPDGAVWRADGWTVEFDPSPTYTRGAPDSTEPSFSFIDSAHPMASHPDQLWIGEVAQRQVGSLAEVAPGTFFHDQPADRLYIGSDPTGAEVRASDLVKAMTVRAEGVVLRGFGIRRYAPSVPDLGAVTLEQPGITIEQVAITDSATTGLSLLSTGLRVHQVYVAGSGMLGVHGNHADDVVVDGLISEGNNTELFNSSPVSGGLKITRSRGVTVRNSVFRNNAGQGLWLDESVYDVTVVGNEMRGNTSHGAVFEISAKVLFADNVVEGNGGNGIKVNNTTDVSIWNNTFVGNGRSINLVQDPRRYGDGSPGADPRYPNDPTITWLLGPVTVANNVVANPTSGNCLLCVEDFSKERTAEQIGVTADGNAYNRPSDSAPEWVAVWSRAGGDPDVFTTLDDFRAATGQEAGGVIVTGPAIVTPTGSPTPDMPPDAQALPLPAEVAAIVGQVDGTRHFGAW
jgi:hypothetical protein